MAHLTFTLVVENAGVNYSAYVPDIPGCVAVGDTIEEVLESLREAIILHLEGLREDGEPIPPATTISQQIPVEWAS